MFKIYAEREKLSKMAGTKLSVRAEYAGRDSARD